MVTVPDKLKPLFPNYRHRMYTRRRPSKRLRLDFAVVFKAAAVRKAAVAVIYLAAIVAVAFYINTLLSSNISVAAFVNGRKIASVSDPEVIRQAICSLTLNSTNLNADFAEGKLPPVTKIPRFNFQTHYRFSLTGALGAEETSSVRECTDKLYDIVRKDYAYSFVVLVDNVPIAASERYGDAADAVQKIEELLSNAANGEGNIDKVRICSSIKVQYGLSERTKILSSESLFRRLAKLLDIHVPTGANVAWAVASNVNPELDFGVNRVITLNGTPVTADALPAIQTENIKIETETCPVDYKTRYIESEDHYVGETFVQTKGSEGLQLVTYDLVIEGGEVVDRHIASREIIIAPVDEIIVVGTKPLPLAVPTGTFAFPVVMPYSITSGFGEQRVEFDGDAYHYGVDFAGQKGDPVYAADGGTVIYTGYTPSYGLMIKVDHGGGMITVYAHCSKLLVEQGDKVYKGQQIALIGDTGVTTGTHLHFEIRKNGAYQNPLKYLEK